MNPIWLHPRGDLVRVFAEAPQGGEIVRRIQRRFLEIDGGSMKIRIRKTKPDAILPVYATEGAAGLDLCAAEGGTLLPGSRRAIPTGIAIELPPGYEGQVRPRSGLARKHGIGMVNAPGTIDSDYRGEIHVLLVNLGRDPWVWDPGDRIAQLVIARVERVELVEADELSETERGEKGFGSTGISAQVPRTYASEGEGSGLGGIGDPGAAGAAEGVQP